MPRSMPADSSSEKDEAKCPVFFAVTRLQCFESGNIGVHLQGPQMGGGIGLDVLALGGFKVVVHNIRAI